MQKSVISDSLYLSVCLSSSLPAPDRSRDTKSGPLSDDRRGGGHLDREEDPSHLSRKSISTAPLSNSYPYPYPYPSPYSDYVSNTLR
jgi:hypothetical protein